MGGAAYLAIRGKPRLNGVLQYLLLRIGSVPGSPVHTGQQWVFGSPPKSGGAGAEYLDLVESSTWVSSPTTISYFIALPPFREGVTPESPLCSKLWASPRILPSSNLFPISCMPMGRPLLSLPHGRLTAGRPAIFHGHRKDVGKIGFDGVVRGVVKRESRPRRDGRNYGVALCEYLAEGKRLCGFSESTLSCNTRQSIPN